MFEKEVQAGAKWLDRYEGINWDLKIDIDRLDISSSNRCVCGQIAGSVKVASACAANPSYMMERGFALFLDSYIISRTMMSEYDKLTATWKREIKRRRAVRAMMEKAVEMANKSAFDIFDPKMFQKGAERLRDRTGS